MPRFSKLLVIAESPVFREVLSGILSSHADQVLTTASAREGRQRIAEHADISLVLSDAAMSDGNALQLLEYIASLGDPKPGVILVAAQPGRRGPARLQHGCDGISSRSRLRCRRSTGCGKKARARPRSPRAEFDGCDGLLVDPHNGEANGDGVSHLAWDIRNVSLTGAFLETKAPLPVKTELHLALDLGRAKGRVKAEVVRVQEPSWRCVGGVGIAFREFGRGPKELLSEYIARATNGPAGLSAPQLAPSGAASS